MIKFSENSQYAEQRMIQHFIKYVAQYKRYHKTVIKKGTGVKKNKRHGMLLQKNYK